MILAPVDEIADEIDEIKSALASLDWSITCMAPELVGGPRWKVLLRKLAECTARLDELHGQIGDTDA